MLQFCSFTDPNTGLIALWAYFCEKRFYWVPEDRTFSCRFYIDYYFSKERLETEKAFFMASLLQNFGQWEEIN